MFVSIMTWVLYGFSILVSYISKYFHHILPTIYLSICLSIYLSNYLPFYLSIHTYIHIYSWSLVIHDTQSAQICKHDTSFSLPLPTIEDKGESKFH